jgi:hypothetical protein
MHVRTHRAEARMTKGPTLPTMMGVKVTAWSEPKPSILGVAIL